MSGPSSATRFKSKRQRTPISSDNLHSDILRRINRNDCASEDDIAELYNIAKPPCQGCRVNSKDSPKCFCGLIPLASGVRKYGLWQKLSEMITDLGADPSEALRSSLDLPSGLTNLGATCYVNSVLQCLYKNKMFRTGVFAAEEELLRSHPVLYQLGLLFAQLHSGNKRAVDSAPFASTLELDSAVQQDGQEFLKLLLTLLERLLGQSRNPEVRSVVQNVFRGTLSHVTRCSKCAQESDASKNSVDFYEIELNVKGLTSLDESLDDYLCEEHLQGENQYFCESCNTGVDAIHCTKLRSLPRVLNFQLKRFVFNAKTAMKKKVTSKFSFPSSINMGPRVSNSVSTADRNDISLLTSVYDISAILVHKGSTANSGHYVAHVRDERTGQWWEYDDEQVTNLGIHPFGDVSTSTPPKKDSSQVSEHVKNVPNLKATEHVSIATEVKVCPETETATSDGSFFTSADAYMLMYSRREPPKITEASSLANMLSDTAEAVDQVVSTCTEEQSMEQLDSILPEMLCSEVEKLNRDYQSFCMEYKLRKEETLSNISNRRTEVKNILSKAPVETLSDSSFWISNDWLRSWADSLSPLPPIDNSSLLCEHGKVPPKKVPLMKRISETAWSMLHARYGGGPPLSMKDCCINCIMDDARAVASANSFRDQRALIRLMLEDTLTSPIQHGKMFLISKVWLNSWQRRKTADGPSEGDAYPNTALRCPHGGLLPDTAPGAKRQVISEEIWHYFLEMAMLAGGDPSNNCASFSVDTPTCATCQAEMISVASQQDDLRATKMEQRQRHEVLYHGKSINIAPGSTYFLAPATWIAQWRAYVGAGGKNVLVASEPCNLQRLMESLVCHKHKGLFFRPPVLVKSRRGELVQKTANVSKNDVFTIISKEDWNYFCEEWDVDPSKGIKAFVQYVLDEASDSTAKDHVGSELQQDDTDSKLSPVPPLNTLPEVCQACVEERESYELMSKLHYADQEIFVDIVRGKEPPRSVLASSITGSEIDRRISKRARRGSAASNGRAICKVSGDTTVYQLKLQIWERLSVVKENQKIHLGTRELDDESATLADLNILPGAHLWVMDTGLHENRDIAEEISEHDIDHATTEEGFRGTLLSNLPNSADLHPTQFEENHAELNGDSNEFEDQSNGFNEELHKRCQDFGVSVASMAVKQQICSLEMEQQMISIKAGNPEILGHHHVEMGNQPECCRMTHSQ